MHPEAFEGFGRMLKLSGVDPQKMYYGLDVGGRNVNGSVRSQLGENVFWCGLDIRPGPDVDIVADAATWQCKDPIYSIVIATELFEHAERWREIIYSMAHALDPGGPQLFIATCASDGRGAHGASGEHTPPEGEWYGNVMPHELRTELDKYFTTVHVEYKYPPGDAYAFARGLR